jgi:hypothetical protein
MGNNILTIDPGKAGTGVAIWPAETFLCGDKTCLPFFHCVMRFKNENTYAERLRDLVIRFNIKKVYMENASFFEGCRGRLVARSGALIVLSEFIGMVRRQLILEGCTVELLTPQRWKGNLPKEIIERRIKKIWPECAAKSHDVDAIGIGFYLLGRL